MDAKVIGKHENVNQVHVEEPVGKQQFGRKSLKENEEADDSMKQLDRREVLNILKFGANAM